jgi:hypothetical protein
MNTFFFPFFHFSVQFNTQAKAAAGRVYGDAMPLYNRAGRAHRNEQVSL